MSRFVVLSGCSGGGKSSLLAELARRGHAAVAEPGRRIVAEQLAIGGEALPWIDAEAFTRRAVEVALADLEGAGRLTGWVFFDRGLVDAAAGLSHALSNLGILDDIRLRGYHRQVFLTPPWPEIYAVDAERRHTFDDAVAEYRRLVEVYPLLGYEIVTVPRLSVEKRADFVLRTLAGRPSTELMRERSG